jgi:hypothetical protein
VICLHARRKTGGQTEIQYDKRPKEIFFHVSKAMHKHE